MDINRRKILSGLMTFIGGIVINPKKTLAAAVTNPLETQNSKENPLKKSSIPITLVDRPLNLKKLNDFDFILFIVGNWKEETKSFYPYNIDYEDYSRLKKLGLIISKRIKNDIEKKFYNIYLMLTPYPTSLLLEKVNNFVFEIQKRKNSEIHYNIMTEMLGNYPKDLIIKDCYNISLDRVNSNLAKTIALISEEVKIPIKLSLLIAIFESSFGKNAKVSIKNAGGIMQLTPDTIAEVVNKNRKELGIIFNKYKGKLGINDPDLYNVIVGILYINLIAKIHKIDLYNEKDKLRNWAFIIIAYDIGPYGITKYIGPEKNLPKETQKYLSRMETGINYVYKYNKNQFA